MRHYAIPFLTLALLLLAACVPTQPSPTGQVVEPIELPQEPEAPQSPETPDTSLPALYTVTYTEGDLVQLKPVAIDPDGTEVTYTFTPPVDADGSWQTRIGDEGEYRVAVGASDGKSQTVETVLVQILRANRPPVIDCGAGVTVQETETVDLHDACTVTDEDDSEVVVTYSGWMTGWRYDTTYDDAGEHTVTITASDRRQGENLHTVKLDVPVRVTDRNREPVFDDAFPQKLRATENEVVSIPTGQIADLDGDTITVTYRAPFNAQGVWRTALGDAGAYDVDVVASDGKTSAKRTVRVEIALLNTAPVLAELKPITVEEGETITLPISATDREGDKLTVDITGWMDSDTYQTTYDDAGEYTVKVTVTDGVLSTSQVVPITVVDVNRPPVFVTPA